MSSDRYFNGIPNSNAAAATNEQCMDQETSVTSFTVVMTIYPSGVYVIGKLNMEKSKEEREREKKIKQALR